MRNVVRRANIHRCVYSHLSTKGVNRDNVIGLELDRSIKI